MFEDTTGKIKKVLEILFLILFLGGWSLVIGFIIRELSK